MTLDDIITDAQAHLNDSDGTLFSLTNLLVYAQIAMRDLEAQLLVNDVQLLEVVSARITVPAGQLDLDDDQPTDLVVPEKMMEIQESDTTPENWLHMERVQTLPIETQNELLRYWTFKENLIKFLGSTANRDVMLWYKRLIVDVSAHDDPIVYLQAQNYLGYRTAALAALRMGEDQERSDSLNQDADKSMELLLAIAVKDNQAYPVRQKRYSSKFKQGYRRLI
jgi:hypothetical protein